jgi:membrane associated rhomboid family serine protease
MIPLADDVPVRRFPWVNTGLILANFAVFLLFELPNQNAVTDWSFYPCAAENACRTAEPWGLTWLTAMFLHAGWDHILGNMVFLFVFGRNVEDAYGHLRYLLFYLAGGLVATATQTLMTLLAGSAADAQVPNLGASGAIAAVLGAYIVLYPRSEVRGLLGIFPAQIMAWVFLGVWFVYQLIEANFGLLSPGSGGGVAFFAHVGGFVFGVLVTLGMVRRRAPSEASIEPGDVAASRRACGHRRERPRCVAGERLSARTTP